MDLVTTRAMLRPSEHGGRQYYPAIYFARNGRFVLVCEHDPEFYLGDSIAEVVDKWNDAHA